MGRATTSAAPTAPRVPRVPRVVLAIGGVVVLVALAVVALGGRGPTYETVDGLEYADLPGNAGTIDLYLPTNQSDPAPVVLWTAGSGWLAANGNHGGAFWADLLAPRGYAVAAVAVRASTQGEFPAPLHDAKAAVRWLRAHADEHGLDPGRIAAMGNSSGGHLAALLGTTGDVAALEGEVGATGHPSDVQAVIDFFGPTDLTQIERVMSDDSCAAFNEFFDVDDCYGDPDSPVSLLLGCPVAACPDRAAQASPVTHVTGEDPPFLILHGTHDPILPFQQSEQLFGALAEACVDATLYAVVDASHDYGFITDPDAAAGQVRGRTRDCGPVTTSTDEPATPALLADFLDAALPAPTAKGR